MPELKYAVDKGSKDYAPPVIQNIEFLFKFLLLFVANLH
jgi:hypothetical protein